jgi:hypothetical protein
MVLKRFKVNGTYTFVDDGAFPKFQKLSPDTELTEEEFLKLKQGKQEKEETEEKPKKKKKK